MLKQHVTLEFFTCKLAASHWVNCQTTSQIYNPERDKVKQVFHTSLSNESHNPHDLAWGYYWKITTLPLLSKEDFPTPPPPPSHNSIQTNTSFPHWPYTTLPPPTICNSIGHGPTRVAFRVTRQPSEPRPNPKLLILVKGRGRGGAKMMDLKGKAQSVVQLFMSWISS